LIHPERLKPRSGTMRVQSADHARVRRQLAFLVRRLRAIRRTRLTADEINDQVSAALNNVGCRRPAV